MNRIAPHVVLIPDCGVLLQLHKQQRLDSLFASFATLAISDACVHELLLHCKSEGQEIALWIKNLQVPVLETRAFNNGRYQTVNGDDSFQHTIADIGLQELMCDINLSGGNTKGVFLLDEHKCSGKQSFMFGSFCIGVTLVAFQRFLDIRSLATEQKAGTPSTEETTCQEISDEVRSIEKTSNHEQLPSAEILATRGFYLNRATLVNPRQVERMLRERAGQTVNKALKVMDKIKSTHSKRAGKPDPDVVETFRKNLI